MLTELIIFTGLMLVVFVGLLVYTAVRLGGLLPMLDYYADTATYRDWLPILWVPALIMALLWAMDANAEQVEWLDYTEIHAGLEVPITEGPSIICQDTGVDDRLTSNLGITQHLVGWHDIDIVATYTHHSCAINEDAPLYDAAGIHIRWTHYWR